MTEKRPTLEPVVGPDVALVLVDTLKRPIVVDWLAGPAERDDAPFIASVTQVPLDREGGRWRVFSGLEGDDDEEEEEEEEEEVEEEVEDAVTGGWETMFEGPGLLLDTPSVATDTW